MSNRKGHPGAGRFQLPPGMPPHLPAGSNDLISIEESPDDHVSVEHNSMQVGDFLTPGTGNDDDGYWA